ncbi:MAG: hypothetical protein R3F59_13435 [Myxococcota bacterium]
MEDAHGLAVFEGGAPGEVPVAHVDHRRERHRAAGGDEPAVHLLGVDAREVQGRPPAGDGALDLGAVDLDAAHPRRGGLGQQRDGLAVAEGARPGGARDDDAEACPHEHAVDREPERRGLDGGAVRDAEPRDHVDQRLAPDVGHRGPRHDGRVGQEGAGDGGPHVLDGELQQVGVDEVGHRQRDGALPHAEQVEDGEVLARLWHRAVDGGDAEHHGVDAGGPGDHGADQPLVSGHVHERDAAAVGEIEVGEAQRHGDAAGLLLRQPVQVDARERAHQARLAVVDVAGGADHQAAGAVRRGHRGSLRR